LADLTQAIDEAQRLAWRISSDGEHPEAMDLYVRLEQARTEVESIRSSSWATTPEDGRPDWMDLLPESLKLPRSWS
jgi:hypothetical protein